MSARLDRFYVSAHLLPSVTTVTHLVSTSSDHRPVLMSLTSLSRHLFQNSWHFNNSLLEDPAFVHQVRDILSCRSSPSSSDDDPVQTWFALKATLIAFAQVYSRQCAFRRTVRRSQLTTIIDSLPPHSSDRLAAESELRADALHRARGALIRSRYVHLHHVDSPHQYFFSLEKHRQASLRISSVRTADGLLLTDPPAVQAYIKDYFTAYYTPTTAADLTSPDLFSALPSLHSTQVTLLDEPITFTELTRACRALSPGKSPGFDGLSAEFYQEFWDVLGPFFHRCVLDLCDGRSPPDHFTTAVIRLLPKKGDLTCLWNWRPISLLSTDYKIFTKVLSARLKGVLPHLKHLDQTCTVPGRTIFDNLHVVRDLISYSQTTATPLALLSIDQEKAFDRVDHGYLFHVLRRYGFGPRFLGSLQLLYTAATFRVKGISGLTSAAPFRRGIRQGRPLSGQLYVLALEPFLCLLRRRILAYRLSLGADPYNLRSLCLSAYADDVTLVVREDRDFSTVHDVYQEYSAASTSRINMDKSSGLWCGAWTFRADTPFTPHWTSRGMRILGVYLGAAVIAQNWQESRERLRGVLRSWAGTRALCSIRGRVLLANQLAASVLIHRLKVLSPPSTVITQFVKILVSSIWDKVHWVSSSTLCLPVQYGGQGLVSIPHKITAFRIQYLLRILTFPSHPVSRVAQALFSLSFRRLSLLTYLKMSRPLLPASCPPFLIDAICRWRSLDLRRTLPADSASVLCEPLFFNSSLTNPLSGRPFYFPTWLTAGVCCVGDLLGSDFHWKPLTVLSPPLFLSPSTAARLRLLHGAVTRVYGTRLFSSPAVRQDPDSPLPPPQFSLRTRTGRYASTLHLSTRDYYKIIVRLHMSPLRPLNPFTLACAHAWSVIYRTANRKRAADIQWRVLHGRTPSPQVLHRFRLATSPDCRFCSVTGTVVHQYLRCPVIQPAIALALSIASATCGTVHSLQHYWFLVPDPLHRHATCNLVFVLIKRVLYMFHLTDSRLSPDSPLLPPGSTVRTRLITTFLTELYYHLHLDFLQHFRANTVNHFLDHWDSHHRLLTVSGSSLRFTF